jgi:DNA-binding beta-propeller fold protein YncE
MKNRSFLGVLAILAVFAACASNPNPPDALKEAQALPFSTNRIYIANMTPPSVTVVNLDNLDDIQVYPVYFKGLEGKDQSHLISVSKDGKYIWLSEDISKDGGYVQVVDARTFEIVKKWEVGAGVGTHISHDGKWGFFSSEKTANPNINVFDIANQRYLGYIELGGWPHNYDTTWDGKTLYTTNLPKGDFLEFDITGLAAIAARTSSDQFGVKLPITAKRTLATGGAGAHGVLVHPNGRYAIVGATTLAPDGVNSAQAFDTFVDLTKAQLTAIAKIPGGNHNFEISPDRKYFISSEWNAQDCSEENYLKNLALLDGNINHPLLRFIDIQTLDTANPNPANIKIVSYLDGKDLGYGSASPMSHEIYDPAGKYLFVTTIQLGDHSKGELVILDGTTRQIVKSVPLPTHPHGLALPGYGR